MLDAMKITMAYFDSKEIPYRADEENNILEVGQMLENKGLFHVLIFFDDDEHVTLHSSDYCKFPVEKKESMYKTCSLVNSNYRWIKFYVDENKNNITLEDDAIIQLDSCAEEIFELICHMINIAEKVYPTFMKALWA